MMVCLIEAFLFATTSQFVLLSEPIISLSLWILHHRGLVSGAEMEQLVLKPRSSLLKYACPHPGLCVLQSSIILARRPRVTSSVCYRQVCSLSLLVCYIFWLKQFSREMPNSALKAIQHSLQALNSPKHWLNCTTPFWTRSVAICILPTLQIRNSERGYIGSRRVYEVCPVQRKHRTR